MTIPFWCDDFDMDLLKVLPETPDLLAHTASIQLRTHGSLDKNGRLSHPTVWNTDRGLAAFFGLRRPAEPRGYVTDQPETSCTFLEAIRDTWCHNYLLTVERRPIWDTGGGLYNEVFSPLMGHQRGWHPLQGKEIGELLGRLRHEVNLAMSRIDVLLMTVTARC